MSKYRERAATEIRTERPGETVTPIMRKLVTDSAGMLGRGSGDARTRANAARRYPVVYFLHGYGQEPDDLVVLSAVFESYMIASDLPRESRFQKFIIVYVDGRCRPNVDGVPVPPGGDGCEGGEGPIGSGVRHRWITVESWPTPCSPWSSCRDSSSRC